MAIITVLEEFDEVLDEGFEEKLEAVEESLNDTSNEVIAANEEINNKISAICVALEAYDDLSNKRISFDQFRYSVFAAESAIYGRVNPSEIFANEAAVLDRLASSISELGHALKVSFSKTADYLQYAYSWFSMQRGATNSLRSKLSRAAGDRVNIRIGINKYMRFGENQNIVRDMSEYNTQYRTMAATMTPFTHSIAELAEDDLFSGLKLFKEGVAGDPEKWFADRFYSVEGHLKKAMSGIGQYATKRDRKYTEYQSPVMLGLSSIAIRLPEKALYRSGAYEDLYGAHRYFYAYVDRKVKIKFSTLLDGSTNLEVKKADALKNLDESLRLIEGALKLTSLAARFSDVGAGINGSLWIHSKRKREEGFSTDVFESMMFYRRISALIYDSVSSAYNFSMGNIKQMNRIASKMVDKL